MSPYRNPNNNITGKSFLEIVKDNTIESAFKKRLIEEQETDKISKKLLIKVKVLILKASKAGDHTIDYFGPRFFREKKWNNKVIEKLITLLREEGLYCKHKRDNMDYHSSTWIQVTWRDQCLPSD